MAFVSLPRLQQARRDSNPQPEDLESPALPLELLAFMTVLAQGHLESVFFKTTPKRGHFDSLWTVCLLQAEQNFFSVNLSALPVRAFVVW
jgi:hypothetical protein